MKILTTILAVTMGFAAMAAGDRQVFLKVNPTGGISKTHKSGSGHGLIRSVSTLSGSSSSSKTVTRNMTWDCEVRYRGKPRPEKVEVRVFYIGYEGNAMKPVILGNGKHELQLDEGGKASVELESPTTRFSRSKSGGGFTGRGRISHSKSTTRGERMAGCVVQLFEDGRLVKSYASQSAWEHAAKNENFNEEVLNRKEKNRLN